MLSGLQHCNFYLHSQIQILLGACKKVNNDLRLGGGFSLGTFSTIDNWLFMMRHKITEKVITEILNSKQICNDLFLLVVTV